MGMDKYNSGQSYWNTQSPTSVKERRVIYLEEPRWKS
jgi:hypothetical protein